MSSLPVPVSPWISTAESVGATMRTAFKACRMPWLVPIIWCSGRKTSRRVGNIVLAKVAMIGFASLFGFVTLHFEATEPENHPKIEGICSTTVGCGAATYIVVLTAAQNRLGFGPPGALGNDDFATPEQKG